MKLGRDAVPALSQTKAVNNQDNRKNDFLASNFKPEIPDLTFLSKGQLRRVIEEQAFEITKLKCKVEKDLDLLIEKTEENNKQKRLIIDLYCKINSSNSDKSPLRIAG